MSTVDARALSVDDLTALIREIPQGVDAYKAGKREQWPVRSNRASELGHPCERFLVYHRVAWKMAAKPSIDLQYIFDEGNRSEDAGKSDLRASGYTITEDQRTFEWAAKDITGTIDGKILLPKGHPHPRAIPFDLKSTNPYDYTKINTVADMLTSDKVWVKKIPMQMMAYLLMNAQEEVGAVILRDRLTGHMKAIEVRLDYTLAEAMVQKAERVNQSVSLIRGTGWEQQDGAGMSDTVTQLLPPRIPYDQDVCGRCLYFSTCLPDQAAKLDTDLFADAELAQMLDRRAELKPLSAEYDAVDGAIKKRVGDRERAIVGNWLIRSVLRERKEHTVKATQFRQYTFDRLTADEGGTQ
jgi:hypothetical protein